MNERQPIESNSYLEGYSKEIYKKIGGKSPILDITKKQRTNPRTQENKLHVFR